ncbi:MAG: dihydropteroate synthase [Pirellulales bacterium]|nr:dihydropteroate synthase [Pirellulales bacterium]
MNREHIHFVTGRLAEHALRRQVAELAAQVDFDASISVLSISVAALMTTQWAARKLQIPPGVTRVLLPGLCGGDLSVVQQAIGVPVERGPSDLRELPEYFGQAPTRDYGAYDIEILAEINHAPRIKLDELLAQAEALAADGADVIDLGCDPAHAWSGVAEAVRALRDRGLRVSIDSMRPAEIAAACAAGAELVLSVNQTNRDAAADWGAEVVAIPDHPHDLRTLDDTLTWLARRGVRHRIDPVLEPIGFGFAASLGRYLEVRHRYPEAELMMGIGNLTELTDCDSAAVNVLLLGVCQELGVRSVLTTQVINWARSSVRECDLARRLAHYSVTQRALPKHVAPELVLLRDPKLLTYGEDELRRIASGIKDPNYRVFAEEGVIHLMAAGLHLWGSNPFDLFRRLQALEPANLDAAHAFYLGYELAKATTALTLDKQYQQDQALRWGYLTRPEIPHAPGHRQLPE